jgi:hypothetical protein
LINDHPEAWLSSMSNCGGTSGADRIIGRLPMAWPIEVLLPVEPGAGIIAHTVVLSFAHSEDWTQSQAADLGLICDLLWQELLTAPLVTTSHWRMSATPTQLRLDVEGVGGEGGISSTGERMLRRLVAALENRAHPYRVTLEIARA